MNDLIRAAAGRGGSDEKRPMNEAIRAAAGRGPASESEAVDPGETFRADYAAVQAAQPEPEADLPAFAGSADGGARNPVLQPAPTMNTLIRHESNRRRRAQAEDRY